MMHGEIAAAPTHKASEPRNDKKIKKPLSSKTEGRGDFFCGEGDDSLIFKYDQV